MDTRLSPTGELTLPLKLTLGKGLFMYEGAATLDVTSVLRLRQGDDNDALPVQLYREDGTLCNLQGAQINTVITDDNDKQIGVPMSGEITDIANGLANVRFPQPTLTTQGLIKFFIEVITGDGVKSTMDLSTTVLAGREYLSFNYDPYKDDWATFKASLLQDADFKNWMNQVDAYVQKEKDTQAAAQANQKAVESAGAVLLNADQQKISGKLTVQDIITKDGSNSNLWSKVRSIGGDSGMIPVSLTDGFKQWDIPCAFHKYDLGDTWLVTFMGAVQVLHTFDSNTSIVLCNAPEGIPGWGGGVILDHVTTYGYQSVTYMVPSNATPTVRIINTNALHAGDVLDIGFAYFANK
ncbi:BppU family phage baseplate upper protein [Furfurilactobacillus rossiae]|uniref:BppU N-terminal domain-containing protein n=1 Tax=Furfurilactobacillus rossiae DSM 15814 TaxID=1114972 RepID=A0A0R1RKC8_9LACO|nr:BppU family phage baseplate upper protein [Furfurilactobacillus rossiae]KRL56686.1 hypothetical protein FD35_GL001785 [Furfurilactobacillus rossiae DSM 15814]QFR66413.1 hypothetical protein LR814_04600 [Furfurilactobacillus rossiae]QLE61869.1 hypothetical protein LROSRS0_1824 [Furfurilactobacillus rossiae]